jgi:hypothetical protein
MESSVLNNRVYCTLSSWSQMVEFYIKTDKPKWLNPEAALVPHLNLYFTSLQCRTQQRGPALKSKMNRILCSSKASTEVGIISDFCTGHNSPARESVWGQCCQPGPMGHETPPLKITRAKWTGGVAQVVECLIDKHKTLSSNPSPTKKRKKFFFFAKQSEKAFLSDKMESFPKWSQLGYFELEPNTTVFLYTWKPQDLDLCYLCN